MGYCPHVIPKPPTFIDHPRDIGARVRALRKGRGITAKRLAASAGVSAAYVSSIENGHRALTMHIAAKVADALGVSVSDIGPTTAALTSANTPTENVASTVAVEAGNGLAVFQYNAKNVRTLDMAGRRWAVAADICDILGLEQVSAAVSRLESSDTVTIRRSEAFTADISAAVFWNQVDPRVHTLILVSEDGATDLLLSSRKKIALAFRRWLVREVFASVRDNGSYVLTTTVPNAVSRHMPFINIPEESLYVAEISGFGTKVGVSANVSSRISQLHGEANRWGFYLGKVACTASHAQSRTYERMVIDRFSPTGSEYMRGVRFDEVARYVTRRCALITDTLALTL